MLNHSSNVKKRIQSRYNGSSIPLILFFVWIILYGGLNRVGTMFERYENEEKKVLQPFDAAKICGPVCLRVKYTNWV